MTISSDKPRRRWFRYSLRTLFVLVTIFGVWLGAQVQWIRDRREALSDYQSATGEEYDPNGKVLREREKAPWSLRLFGEQGTKVIYFRGGHSDEAIERKRIETLFPEATLIEACSSNYIPPREAGLGEPSIPPIANDML